MKKLTLYLWDLILGQKLVISSTVILPFEKKIYIYIWKSAGSGRDLSTSLFNSQEHNKNVFSFKQHLSAGAWWLP